MGKYLRAERRTGYVAPALDGIWLTAPYLHNGSVPTLWHLMHPRERPRRFIVGGHRLDYARVGIAGEVASDGVYRDEPAHRAFAESVLIDTLEHGRSNAGHSWPFELLDESQKRSLLEYLKLL